MTQQSTNQILSLIIHLPFLSYVLLLMMANSSKKKGSPHGSAYFWHSDSAQYNVEPVEAMEPLKFTLMDAREIINKSNTGKNNADWKKIVSHGQFKKLIMVESVDAQVDWENRSIRVQ